MMQFSENPVGAIIWIAIVVLVLSPLFVAIAAVAAMLLGWLWSPFAALICWLRARSLGLDARRYAKAGALYSALFFLPWLYLTLRMFGKTVADWMVSAGYFVLYLIWLLGPIGVTFLVCAGSAFRVFSSDPADPDPTAFDMLLFCSLLALLCANLVAMGLSAWDLERKHRRLAAADREKSDFFPHRLYVMPFAHTLAAVAVTGGALLIVRVVRPDWW